MFKKKGTLYDQTKKTTKVARARFKRLLDKKHRQELTMLSKYQGAAELLISRLLPAFIEDWGYELATEQAILDLFTTWYRFAPVLIERLVVRERLDILIKLSEDNPTRSELDQFIREEATRLEILNKTPYARLKKRHGPVRSTLPESPEKFNEVL